MIMLGTCTPGHGRILFRFLLSFSPSLTRELLTMGQAKNSPLFRNCGIIRHPLACARPLRSTLTTYTKTSLSFTPPGNKTHKDSVAEGIKTMQPSTGVRSSKARTTFARQTSFALTQHRSRITCRRSGRHNQRVVDLLFRFAWYCWYNSWLKQSSMDLSDWLEVILAN